MLVDTGSASTLLSDRRLASPQPNDPVGTLPVGAAGGLSGPEVGERPVRCCPLRPGACRTVYLPLMTAGPQDDGDRRGARGGAQLWAQLWSDRSLIPPARYCVYDAFVGVIALALAVMVLVEPGRGTTAHVVVYGAMGITLLGGPLLALRRPATLPRLLAINGVLLMGLGFFFAGDGAVWALRAPAQAPFRYAPGVSLCLLLFGAMHLADPGSDSVAIVRRRRWVRKVALITGIICELFVVGTLIARAMRS